MTTEAKMEISRILLMAEERLIGAHGPFLIIHQMLRGYMDEWGWMRLGG
jgi:hypothetical protein